jgi:hypothetical protein
VIARYVRYVWLSDLAEYEAKGWRFVNVLREASDGGLSIIIGWFHEGEPPE